MVKPRASTDSPCDISLPLKDLTQAMSEQRNKPSGSWCVRCCVKVTMATLTVLLLVSVVSALVDADKHKCPKKWFGFESKCFLIDKTSRTWRDAERIRVTLCHSRLKGNAGTCKTEADRTAVKSQLLGCERWPVRDCRISVTEQWL
ncbi:hypothetical protein DPEC_G00367540 [Dallia pectoralis]|nr:hypothetical protein DPEC_G00367540 [Dallia pectoralis]